MTTQTLALLLSPYFASGVSRTLARAIYAATQSPNVPAVCPWYSAYPRKVNS